ncbi:MAG: MazG nucleotide pyrophosphohydrolase domain-containing protein [Candidatus Nanoarchaeia archaeon]
MNNLNLDFNKFKEDTYRTVTKYKDILKEKKDHKNGFFPPYAIIARLEEEYGELCREILHTTDIKPKKNTEDKNTIGHELSDIIFTLMCLVNYKEINNIQEKYLSLNKEKTEQNYNSLLNKKHIPTDYALKKNLGTKINKLSDEVHKKKSKYRKNIRKNN